MMKMKTLSSLALFSAAILGLSLPAGADWPQWRGAQRSGAGTGVVPAAGSTAVNLEVAWRQPLGSGYSSVSVARGLAVTMASIDGGDWIVALDAATGELAWRYRVADTYHGRAGSDDGPASTPALDAEGVYALTASGHIVALELATGEPRWRRHLEDDFGAQPHTYGYSTAPVLLGDLLYLAGGPAEGSTLLALDTATGELRWKAGSGEVEHQNPSVVDLAGAEQVVVPSARAVTGFAAADGAELWSYAFEAESYSGDVTPIDGEHLLVTRWEGNTLLRVQRQDDRFEVREVWTTRDLEGTYAVPVRIGDYLFGFDARFMTCVSLATGERVWRSRPPGGAGLIAVDGLVATIASGGELVLAEASPAGYRERSRSPVFAPRQVMTPPSAAAGMLYVRNLEEIVALRRADAARPAIAATANPGAESPLLRELTAAVAAGRGEAAVEDLFARHPTMPIVADGRVHFFYHGETGDLAVTGDMTGGFAELPMARLAGTDLFHRTFEAPREPAGERWEYVFKSFDESIVDPHNPDTVSTPAGERSVLTFGSTEPEAAEPSTSQDNGCSPGRLVTVRLGEGDAAVPATVRLPAGYDEGEHYPLLIWSLGKEALEFGRIPELLDTVGCQVGPVISAFLELPGRLLWEPQRDESLRVMSEVVLPALEARFRVDPRPANRVLVVQQWALENGLPWVLAEEGVGQLVAQSPMMGGLYLERRAPQAARAAAAPISVHLDWGRYDGINPDWGFDVAAQAAALAELLAKEGHEVRTKETAGGSTWTRWRGETVEILQSLGFESP